MMAGFWRKWSGSWFSAETLNLDLHLFFWKLIFVIIRCETQYQQQCSTDTQEECWQETEEECSQEQECEEAPASQHSSSATSGGHKSRSKRGILKKIAHKAGPLLPLAAFNPLGPLLAKKALPLALAPNPLALAGKKLGLKAGALKAQQLSSGGGSSSGSGHSSSSSGHSSGNRQSLFISICLMLMMLYSGHGSGSQQKCSVVTTCRDKPVRKCRSNPVESCSQVSCTILSNIAHMSAPRCPLRSAGRSRRSSAGTSPSRGAPPCRSRPAGRSDRAA